MDVYYGFVKEIEKARKSKLGYIYRVVKLEMPQIDEYGTQVGLDRLTVLFYEENFKQLEGINIGDYAHLSYEDNISPRPTGATSSTPPTGWNVGHRIVKKQLFEDPKKQLLYRKFYLHF